MSEIEAEAPDSVKEAARLSDQEAARVFSSFDDKGDFIEDCLADTPMEAARRAYMRLAMKSLAESPVGNGEWNRHRDVWVAGRGTCYRIGLQHVSRKSDEQ